MIFCKKIHFNNNNIKSCYLIAILQRTLYIICIFKFTKLMLLFNIVLQYLKPSYKFKKNIEIVQYV